MSKTVYMIRHGQSEANIMRNNNDPRADTAEVTDTVLAETGNPDLEP